MIKGIDFIGVSVCFFCHDAEGWYLMHRRTDKCRDEHWTWDFGSGGVRHGESLEQALLRELKEEYDVTPLSHTFLGFREVQRMNGDIPNHWLAFDFRVQVDPAQVRVAEPEKVDAIDWFSIDALPDPLHSAIPGTLAVRYDDLAEVSKRML